MSMFQLYLLYQFSILFEVAVALLFIFCLKLKSGIFKRIFPTVQKSYLCVYYNSAMAGPSDAMKPERFAGGNFYRWQTRVKFWLMSMGLRWVIHPVTLISSREGDHSIATDFTLAQTTITIFLVAST